MESLWDWLPTEIQLEIRSLASAMIIQETYLKNRFWFFARKRSIKKINPDYDGKSLRNGDRVLITRKNKRLQYGTITSISYSYKYYCRITLLNGKHVYYYKNDHFDYPEQITRVMVLNLWQHCVCHICKKCDMCLLKNI